MDKYVSANKLKAKVISGEPVLFDEATQHEIFFLLELEPSEDVKPVVHAHWEIEKTVYARFARCSACGMGQMYDLAEWLTLAGNDYPRGNDFDIYVAERNVIKGVLEGITSYETVHSEKESDSVRELKTLYEAIRHQQWKDSRAPEWDVRSHEPMMWGKEPVPKIERVDE